MISNGLIHQEIKSTTQNGVTDARILPFLVSVDQILSQLASQDTISLSLTSPDWKHHIKNDTLATLEAEWPVATRSRRILSELASAFGGAIIGPAYSWKHVLRYLESIKSEVDVSIAVHEQLMGLTALAHFILITDDMDASYHEFLRQATEWTSVSASLLSNAAEGLISGEKSVKLLELMATLMSLYHRLTNEWITTFVSDLYRTHVLPPFEAYAASKSPEDALETLILLAESFSKARHFAAALQTAITPLNALTTLAPLKHISCLNLKPALTEALKALPENLKVALFELTFACDSLRADHAHLLYPLYDYFNVVEEPALASFMPKEEGRSFKIPRQACVRLGDDSRLFLPLKTLERFDAMALDLEHATRMGSRLNLDDSLDVELSLPKLIFRSDLDLLLDFVEIIEDSESLEEEVRMETMLKFVQPFLQNPRSLAVLLLSAREIGLKPLQSILESVIEQLQPQPEPGNEE